MTFVDIVFPSWIAMGAQSEPEWSTNVIATLSGFEMTNQNWLQVRHNFDVGLAIRTQTDYQAVRAHFHQVRGRAKSFPFIDPLDSVVTQAQGLPNTTGAAWFMVRRYGSGSDLYDRRITRPISGTITVYRTRSGVTTDATVNATIDYTTGGVTMASHVAGDTYAWAGQFRIACRYDVDKLPGTVVDRQGATGDLLVDCPSIPIIEVREA